MTTSRAEPPECTCTPFVFAEGEPWQVTLHDTKCARHCDCYVRSGFRVGRRGNIVHFPDCGWYVEPNWSSSGKVRGQKALYMITDEGMDL